MWDGFDHRKFPRVNAECRIYIKKDQSQSSPLIAKTENIGVGGLCVVLREALPKLSSLRIQLDLQDGEGPIQCAGRVAWTVESRDFVSEEKTHDTGIEFMDLNDLSRERIKRVILASNTQN